MAREVQQPDWSFMDKELPMNAVGGALTLAAKKFPDLVRIRGTWKLWETDVLLWVASHPRQLREYEERYGDGWEGLFSYRIYSHALREKCLRESERMSREIPLEEEA